KRAPPMSSPNPETPSDSPADPAPKPTRRTFTTEYRNRILDEYNNAPHGEKSAVLRREGLYQSQLREWAQARTAAAGKSRPKAVAHPDTDAATRKEMARLTRENARLAKQLTQTEAALEIMGKLHVLLESISESTDTPPLPKTH
ncbi:transposase, partial [Rhodococcus baikonurensis]